MTFPPNGISPVDPPTPIQLAASLLDQASAAQGIADQVANPAVKAAAQALATSLTGVAGQVSRLL